MPQPALPKSYQALILTGQADAPLRLEQVPLEPLAAGQVRVRLAAAALNHRDLWIVQGKYPGIVTPTVLGSDGAGTVVEVADAAHERWLGAQVVINPNIDWGSDARAQGPDYQILGLAQRGTFQEYVAVPAHRLAHAPGHLTPAQAAALPLAGLTAYRATIVHGQASAGKLVLVTGIGGGVAQWAFALARAVGATVFVTSGSADKLARMQALGAAGGALYTDKNWARELAGRTGGFDLIVDSAGGAGLNDLVDAARPGGSLVFFGATAGNPPELNMRKVFWKQLRLQGSTMGTDAEFAALLEFVAQHRIEPLVSSERPFAEILEAFADMEAGRQFGKLVVTF